MTIVAKYSGTCSKCSCSIVVGQKIEWTKGAKPTHTACEPVSLDGQPAIRAQHWSQRGNGPAVRLCAGGCGRRVGPRYAECYSCHQESIDAM